MPFRLLLAAGAARPMAVANGDVVAAPARVMSDIGRAVRAAA